MRLVGFVIRRMHYFLSRHTELDSRRELSKS